jgi:hypothetical protein
LPLAWYDVLLQLAARPGGLVGIRCAETTALAAPISIGDAEGVRLLLAAGADPNTPLPRDAEAPSSPAVYAAIRSYCPTELVQLLLEAGADPDAAGPDGRAPHQLAARRGRADVARLVRRYGARPSATDVDFFLAVCMRADRPAAERNLRRVDLDRLGDHGYATIARAAEVGNTAAVELMIDLGFPVNARSDDGGTPLRAAAYSGSAETAHLLLDRGADLEARDTTWEFTPLVWATVGSGERPTRNPQADWVATVRALLAAGASTEDITLSPEDPKPPSPEVAHLLRAHGVPNEHSKSKR